MTFRVEHLAEGVSLYLGDCREVLPTLEGIKHVITDPPYEDELHAATDKIRRNDGRVSVLGLTFDGINESRDEIAAALVKASSGWLIVFTLAEGVRAWRDPMQAAGAKWDTTLAWVKPDASPRFNGQGAARGFECAVTAWCGPGYRKWNGGGKRGIYTHCVNFQRQGEHPTEKPLPLMAELLRDYTQAGELICDPFMGSGTTGVAAVKLGRQFIGIEQNQQWFDLACRRISDALARPDFFVSSPKPIKQEAMRLIAAAPELLRTLQQLHDDIAEYARINNLGGYDNHVMRQARAAVALAIGEKI